MLVMLENYACMQMHAKEKSESQHQQYWVQGEAKADQSALLPDVSDKVASLPIHLSNTDMEDTV